jgi:predicted DNA-binding protein with PD1-like motif
MLTGQVGKICFSRLLQDEDLAEVIKKKAEEAGIRAGAIIAIGSLKDVVLGYYKEREYRNTRLDGPLEMASCTGNIAVDEEGQVIVHVHLVVSDEKGRAFGGHLMKGSHVGATAELMMIEAVGVKLQKAFDQETNLKLLKLR